MERELLLSPQEKGSEILDQYFLELEGHIKRGLYALGYLTYELGYLLEDRLKGIYRNPKLPLAYFALFREIKPINLPVIEDGEDFEIHFKGLNQCFPEYQRSIEKIRDYIAQGDTYQVNYTVKLKFHFSGNPFNLFQRLIFSQRCEYAFFIERPQFVILSLSPELFLQKKGDLLISAPMKGTIRRAFNLEEDILAKKYLKKDIKNQAENLMIVDLIRNDLGRVSVPGSVWVKKLFQVKTYPTLHQMISTVEGKIEGFSLKRIFQALFPCGSVTGAPKIRTMEIIRELETEPRGIYTGALGFITPKGDFLFNVAIRTLHLNPLGGDLYQGELGIGAGILWDSSAEAEYDETLLKSHFLLKPLPPFKIFETLWWSKERENPHLELHYHRLRSSARYFGFPLPKELRTFRAFREFLSESLGNKKEGLHRVKVLLCPDKGLEMEIKVLEKLHWEKPIRVGLLRRKDKPSLFHFHKTTLREEYNQAYATARDLGLTEVLFYNERGELLEGSISNLFLEKDDTLYTPPTYLGILPGTLRKRLLLEGKAKEAIITLDDLRSGGILWIGNSLRGLGKVEEWVIL